jgi:hypothetical protein
MPDVIISPNMGLPIPVVGVDPGPDWATNVNASLTAVDSHNHSSGQGVPVTPDGLNINADLPMNNNNLITARTLRFQPQVSAPALAADLGCLTEIGVDLYYIDGAGNQIRITQSGSLAGAAGTITGLPSGTASAAFAAGTFTFQKSTGVPASINAGSIKIGQEVASGFGVTLGAAVGQAANYNLTLPAALPASTKFATIDSSGNIGDTYDVDNSTLEVSGGLIQEKDGGTTRVKLAPIGQQLSASCGNYQTTSNSYSTITNLSCTITTTGRMVAIIMLPVGDINDASYLQNGSGASGEIRCDRGGANVGTVNVIVDSNLIPGSLTFYDFQSAGTYTYTMQARAVGGIGFLAVRNFKLLVYEVA